MAKNTDFRGGYIDVLAPDRTKLLEISSYLSSSSWKSGSRVHIGYREDQVVVDHDELYGFHWDYPLINYVNDYKNGKYYVYVSREDDTGGAGYGISETDYPAIYHLRSPFDEGWGQDGGSCPGDEDPYGRTADWSITAADDHPAEMLLPICGDKSAFIKKKYCLTDMGKSGC